MTAPIHIGRFRLAPADVGGAVAALAPAGGFVALYAPDGARLADRADADADLATAGSRWSAGRAFDDEREVIWRCEGQMAVVVVAVVVVADRGAGVPTLDLPAGPTQPEELPGTEMWTPLGTGRLYLWGRQDLRVARPDYPRSLAHVESLSVTTASFGPGYPAWIAYQSVTAAEEG